MKKQISQERDRLAAAGERALTKWIRTAGDVCSILRLAVFEIRFDDLDVNKHVNNANYVVWAFEPLDFEFRQKHKLKTLDMVFKKEITFGSKVLSCIKIDDNITIHLLRNYETGEDLCHVCAEWEGSSNNFN